MEGSPKILVIEENIAPYLCHFVSRTISRLARNAAVGSDASSAPSLGSLTRLTEQQEYLTYGGQRLPSSWQML